MSKTKQSFRCCFCFKRMFKIDVVEPPEDVRFLFKQYSENDVMSIDHLHNFLMEIQEESNATKESAQAIFNSVKHLNIFQRKGLHLEAFFRYLLSDINSPLISPSEVHHDMTAPLAHYFLYTGHNSYLTGNQLSSDCRVEPIINALKKGVRVIELDLWPNSREDDVEVRHGGTLTKPVELIKCLRAIRDYAFSASEYPLVITFEDHLAPILQDKVAKMVMRTFRGMLFSRKQEFSDHFPSPESLKGKILISTKPPKEYLESQELKEQKDKGRASEREEEDLWQQKTKEAESKEGDLIEEEDEQKEDTQYRELIAIHAVKPKGLTNLLSTDNEKAKRLSMSELKLEEVAEQHGADIVRFTQKNLLRIYPKGTRITSSNYNPLVGWMHGAQMVAFNMQGHGKFLWIMQGMFRANGGCGYVKKPDFLLNETNIFGPKETGNVKSILKVKLYLGIGWDEEFSHTKFDYYSPPDLFIRIGIAGVPADSVMKKTKPLEDQWRPKWNDHNEFSFELTVPELALLRLEVYDYDTSGDHDFAGQTCLPVWELRSGIRCIPLHDRRGEVYKHDHGKQLQIMQETFRARGKYGCAYQ